MSRWIYENPEKFMGYFVPVCTAVLFLALLFVVSGLLSLLPDPLDVILNIAWWAFMAGQVGGKILGLGKKVDDE